MLWMLGVVAILVDVVSRFSGDKIAIHPKLVKVVHTTTTTTTTLRPDVAIEMSPPEVEVTYVLIKETSGANSFPVDNNDVSPNPEEASQIQGKDHKSLADDIPKKRDEGNGDSEEVSDPRKMEPSDTVIEKSESTADATEHEASKNSHKLG